jgi:hypothetical protein
MPCMTTIDHMAFDAIPTLKANLARGYASLTKVLQDKTTVHRAMYREGVGWIDFIWGDEGRWPPSNKGRRKGARGLSHTIEARQRKDNLTYREVIELLGRMVLAIAEGEESLRIPVGKSERIIVGRDGTEVHLLKRPGSNAWTLTVFDVWKDGEGDALDAACDAIQPTRYGATPGRTVTVAPSMVSDADLRLRAWTHSLCGRQAGADDITSVGHAAVHRNLDSTDSDLIARIETAAQESAFGHNPRPIPSEAQCAAGNYKLGRVDWRGLKLAIEQPRNSYREGTDKNGVKWRTRLAAHYGYISGTRGADGDPVDCFIGTFPTAETAYVINQYVDGRFDEHKLMLCFMDEPSAIRAYLDSYDRGWSGLHSIVPASITQLRWWLQNGNLSRQLTPESLPFEGKSTMLKPAHNVYWDYAACEPREDSIPAILYRLRAEDPGNDLLMDSVSLADIYSEADAILTFDAMVTPYAKLEARLNILKAVMERSGGAVKPVALQISEPFKQRGVANVAGVFELSDGQTVSVFFHNPDVTPKKIQPADELISWKWLLNKKDITIVVAPEQGHDLNVREVARRLMKLAEKNSAAFVRANAKRAERMQSIEALKSEAARKEAELADLNHQIEVAKVEREDRDASGAELPPQTIKNASEETLAYVGMNADGDAVYQNDAGARWLRKKNLLTGEATKGGKPVEPREDEYLTAEELAATKNANAAEGQKRYEPTPAIAASMSSNEIPADKEDAHQYRKAAFEIIRTRYGNKPPVPITTKDGSIVLVGMGGLKHVLKDGLPSWQETVATLHAEEIIANADYLGSEPDYKKRTEIKAVHRYGASIEIDGEEYGAVIVVMEASDGKRYYDHTVTAKGESPAGLLADPSTTEVDEESGRPFTGLPDNQNINQLPLKSTDPDDTPEVEVPALIEVAKVEAEDGKATMRTWQDASGRQSDPAEGAAIIETWDASKADALLVETQTGQEDATPEAVARKFIAQHLQGRLVRTRIGDCLINSVTKGKLPQAAGRKGGLKLMAVARVPEILIHGEVGSLEENHKERSDTFDGFYPFTHTLQFDDKLVQARIKVGHRAQTPNLVYSLDVSRVALDSTQKDESPNLTRRCTSVSAVVDLGLEGASDFREELFRGPGVPSEPTTEPGSTSSSLLTMDSMVEQDDNGINIVILKVIDKKTGERLYDLEDDVGQEGHEPKPESVASLSPAEEAVWRESGASGDEIGFIARAGGYSAILADTDKQLTLQDILDRVFQERVVAVRNALRELGWDGRLPSDARLYKGESEAQFTFRNVGAGANVVGYSVNGLVDDLTKSPEEFAAEVDAAAKAETQNEPEPQPNDEWVSNGLEGNLHLESITQQVGEDEYSVVVGVTAAGPFWQTRKNGKELRSVTYPDGTPLEKAKTEGKAEFGKDVADAIRSQPVVPKFIVNRPDEFVDAPESLIYRMNAAEAEGKVAILIDGVSSRYTLYTPGFRVNYNGEWELKEQGPGPEDAITGALRYNDEKNIIAMTSTAKAEIDRRRDELEAQRKADAEAKAKAEAERIREMEMRTALETELSKAKFKKGKVKLAGTDQTADAWIYNGVAAHKSPISNGKYTITHVATGLRLVEGMPSLGDAKLAAVRIANSGDMAALNQQTGKGEEFAKTRETIKAVQAGDPLAKPEIDAPQPVTIGPSPLDEFEQAGGEPWQVTQAKWVEIMRGHMRSLGQPEESGTAAAPYSDYEQFHKEKVRQAITEGKPIPAEVLADYPDLQAAPVDVQPPEPVTASETEEPPTITLTGKEFGDFPDTEEGKKALRSAAIDYYDKELMGRDGVLNVALDKVVEFNAEGRNKIKSFSADPRKLHLVHALRSIVAGGKPTPISPLKPHAKAAKKGVVAVHVLKTPVMLGGERIKARFLVYEKADGHLFYDHSVDRGEMMAAMGRSGGAMDSADAADLDSSVLLSDEPSSEHRRTDTVGDSHEGFNLDDATVMAVVTPMVFNLVIDDEEPEMVESGSAEEPIPAPAEDPQKTADTAFLQSIIDGQADILDPDFAGKLEALFGAYANDPDMLDLLNRAITAYSEAMMGKASSAMAA